MRRLLLIGVMMALYTTAIAQPKKLLGGDVSLLPSYEAQHTVYKDFNGRKVSFLPFVKQQGWNAILSSNRAGMPSVCGSSWIPPTHQTVIKTRVSTRICPMSSN